MMSNLIEHAKKEFLALGYPRPEDCEDGPDRWIQEQVIELLSVFANQGHSGFSAPYAIHMFKTLASFGPLCPLTGEDHEWNEVGEGMWQNNRCSRVFKDADGRAYDIEGKVFREPNGACFTSRDSRVYVTFPYTPTTEYVDVPASA